MIYPAEADIVTFLKNLTLSLQAYAKVNEVTISFAQGIKKQVLQYQPFLLSQSIVQLLCNMINLIPPKSNITVRILYSTNKEYLQIEVENSGINLIRVNEVCAKTAYSFTAYPLPNGTIYHLELPLQVQAINSTTSAFADSFTNNLPQFYKEIQKRFHSHFTQSEKLFATLEKNLPQEAAFMQKINALIKVNIENDNFDTNALCKAMSLSRTQLFRRLKLLINQAPANYIKLIRLQKAKELLETTEFTVSEIAFKAGFQAISHFTKIFKKQYGIAPSIYRQSNSRATNE